MYWGGEVRNSKYAKLSELPPVQAQGLTSEATYQRSNVPSVAPSPAKRLTSTATHPQSTSLTPHIPSFFLISSGIPFLFTSIDVVLYCTNAFEAKR